MSVGGCTKEQYEQVLAALHSDAAAAEALCSVFTTQSRTNDVVFGLNTMFLIFSGALVFIMHGGFAMLEAGAIRSKNAMNILLQTVLDGAASSLMWYLVGFGFAYGVGDNPNPFIGDALFGLARFKSHPTGLGVGFWPNWFFQWAFAATAATIPAGSVAERFNFNAYLGYSLFLGGFVYPVVVHWVWCSEGWLGYGRTPGGPLVGAGMIDFAGSGVVHMVGGLAGLVGAWLVGPRLGRFDMDGRPVAMPGHSAILVVLGTVLLWFGWYGFNPGSALVLDNPASATIAGRAAVTTTLSGAAGGLTCLLLAFWRHVAWDLISLCNGMLVGFVAVTAGAHVLEPWAAILCGAVAAFVFEGMCAVLLKLQIDDVVSAGPMHGFCGMWGVFFVGLLAKEEYVREAYPGRANYPYGLFYGGGGRLLASQVIGILAIAGWTVGLMGPFFAAFKALGMLRISAEEEHTGLDVSKHGGSAYHMTHNPNGTVHGEAGPGLGMGGVGPINVSNHHNYHNYQPKRSKGMVGDAIMRGNTMGFQSHMIVGTAYGNGNANGTASNQPSNHPSNHQPLYTSGGYGSPTAVAANGYVSGHGHGHVSGGGAGSEGPTQHSVQMGPGDGMGVPLVAIELDGGSVVLDKEALAAHGQRQGVEGGQEQDQGQGQAQGQGQGQGREEEVDGGRCTAGSIMLANIEAGPNRDGSVAKMTRGQGQGQGQEDGRKGQSAEAQA